MKEEYGGGKFDFGLDMSIIPNGKAETEGGATLDALSLDLGPEHSRTVSLAQVASKTTDSAPTATASSTFVGDERARQFPHLKPMKKRRCQNHVHSFLCQHFIGQRAKKTPKVPIYFPPKDFFLAFMKLYFDL